jgi:hypothetical protein
LDISDYTRKFNDYHSFWKTEISEKLATYLFVMGLRCGLPSLGRKENCLLTMSKEIRILGLKPNRSYLRQNYNKDLRLALALIVVSRVISLRIVLS